MKIFYYCNGDCCGHPCYYKDIITTALAPYKSLKVRPASKGFAKRYGLDKSPTACFVEGEVAVTKIVGKVDASDILAQARALGWLDD